MTSFSQFEPVLEANLGAHWRYRFTEIDTDVPLGAASIAQVYRAVQRDGEEVVVKVQRPGVAASTRLDMEILAQAVKLADVEDNSLPPVNWGGLVVGLLVLGAGAFFLVRRLRR